MSARQTADSRRLKIMLGGGLGLVAVLFLVTKVLGGGGGEVTMDETPAPASTPTTAAPAATPGGATAPGDAAAPAPTGEAPVETFEVFSTKNPFKPLRTAKVASPASAAPSTKGATAPAPATVTAPVVTPVSLNPVASTGITATGGQATEPVRTTKVALVDVFVEGERAVATVRVNDTVSKVGAGDSFSGNFRVVSLDTAEQCGRFLYGDDQFRLCRGEEVLK